MNFKNYLCLQIENFKLSLKLIPNKSIMKNKVLLGFAALTMVAFLSSCGKVPQEKIDAANAAIDSAKMVEAHVYVAADFMAV